VVIRCCAPGVQMAKDRTKIARRATKNPDPLGLKSGGGGRKVPPAVLGATKDENELRRDGSANGGAEFEPTHANDDKNKRKRPRKLPIVSDVAL
jgi:hypothetical protein